jgi:hypothetical protein
MNDRDLNLIIDLAAGALDDDAAAEARARIDASPELTREYELQLAVMAELEAAPAVAMTPGERASLRSHVADGLHLEVGTGSRRVAVPTRPSRWRVPAFGLATAAVFVFAIVVTPGLLGGSDSAEDTVALAQLSTTTVAADGADDGGTVLDSALTEESRTSDGQEFAAVPRTDLLAEVSMDELYRAVMEGESTEAGDFSYLQSAVGIEPGVVDACVATIGDGLPEGTPGPVGVAEDGITAVIAIEDGDTILAVAVIDLETCQLIDVRP